jgi:hypothetical protein
MLLPVVLGSGGKFLKSLILQQKKIKCTPHMLGGSLCAANFTYTAYTLIEFLCPTTIPEKAKINLRRKGKDKRQIACLCLCLSTLTCLYEQACKLAYPDEIYLLFFVYGRISAYSHPSTHYPSRTL